MDDSWPVFERARARRQPGLSYALCSHQLALARASVAAGDRPKHDLVTRFINVKRNVLACIGHSVKGCGKRVKALPHGLERLVAAGVSTSPHFVASPNNWCALRTLTIKLLNQLSKY